MVAGAIPASIAVQKRTFRSLAGQREEYPRENKLGVWCCIQRRLFNQKRLSKERITLLGRMDLCGIFLRYGGRSSFRFLFNSGRNIPIDGLTEETSIPRAINWECGVHQRSNYKRKSYKMTKSLF